MAFHSSLFKNHVLQVTCGFRNFCHLSPSVVSTYALRIKNAKGTFNSFTRFVLLFVEVNIIWVKIFTTI